ncbi:MAG: hypothetical protein JXK05_07420 [Campylobacterales bacterium]|nr:hypothetical protein [Campylobacterales bacterium]
MQREAMLSQLGYTPNEALLEQMGRIIANTREFSKIEKHIVDLHEALKVDLGYVAMSNSEDRLKIKVETDNEAMRSEAIEKIEHFAQKYKVELNKLEGKNVYYIIGFEK